ncbi:MAG: phosphoribosylformylglycinamidine synthase subunit PurQ [Bacteriovorax sp.]
MIKRSEIKVIVLTGDGINCESETALAFREQGVVATIIHIQDLIQNPGVLKSAHILVLPGGFSFGDEIGSGQILALKLKYSLGEELKKFIDDKKLVIGICNGFQALVRLGLLPRPFESRTMTLTHNRQGHFIDRWVDINVPESLCVWTKNIQANKISLPIRHGEGKIVFAGNASTQQSTYESLLGNGQIALSYSQDVNGSYQNIAGVCDPTGRIFGLMPHPEAAISNWLNPDGLTKSSAEGIGAKFFESGIEYCESHF